MDPKAARPAQAQGREPLILSPEEVRTSALVQAAYLGTEADTELASIAQSATVLPDPAAT